jgi:transposase
MKKNQGLKNKGGRQPKHDMAFMRHVVLHYKTSNLSTNEVGRLYGVPSNQVTRWSQKYFSDIDCDHLIIPTPQMDPDKQKEINALKKQNEILLQKLEQANLKVTSLEMMIDIAEEDFQFDIRKKYGTKQSIG